MSLDCINDIMATTHPPFLFLPFNISSLFFAFNSFLYSVFGIVCMIFFIDLFCGNKSSSQKKLSGSLDICISIIDATFYHVIDFYHTKSWATTGGGAKVGRELFLPMGKGEGDFWGIFCKIFSVEIL